jgi:hypothetical protein
MQLHNKLALIAQACKNFTDVQVLAATSHPGALLARQAIEQAEKQGLDKLPYTATVDGYYGWVGFAGATKCRVPAVAFMFR